MKQNIAKWLIGLGSIIVALVIVFFYTGVIPKREAEIGRAHV